VARDASTRLLRCATNEWFVLDHCGEASGRHGDLKENGFDHAFLLGISQVYLDIYQRPTCCHPSVTKRLKRKVQSLWPPTAQTFVLDTAATFEYWF
jgi:hypothetical protein